MVYRSHGGWGSFGKGFSDAFAAMLKLAEDKRWHDLLAAHYARIDANNPYAGSRTAFEAGRAGFKEGDTGTYGGEGSQVEPKAGKVSMQEMVKLALNAGFKGDEAAHIAALAQAESGGNPGAVGSAGEIGLTQINPHAWGADMANSARDPQGAFNAAYKVYKQQGWGAWSTDPSSANFTPGNNGLRFIKAARASLPSAEPTVDGKPAVTTIVEGGKDKEPPPGVPKITKEEGKDLQGKSISQADTLPTNQLAGGTDEEAMRIAIEENRKLQEQQNRDTGPGSSAGPAPPLTPSSRGPTGDPASAMEEANSAAARAGIPAQPMMPPRTATPVAPPLQLGPESAFAPPDASVYSGRTATLSPSDMPSSGVGVSVHDSRQGPVLPAYARYPESSSYSTGTLNPPTPAPTYTRTGGAEVNAPLAGGEKDARAEPAEASKPAPDAQPVSATRPTPRVSQPQNNPRFTTVSYETSEGRNKPIYTALNLGSLWGPNPPLAQRGQAAASPPVAAASSRQDDYSDVASMPSQSDYDLGSQIMGSAKGGPIQRFRRGGIPTKPTTKFYGGGVSASAADATGADAGGANYSGGNLSAPPTQYTGRVPYSTWNSPTSTTYVPPGNQPSMGVYAKSLAVPTPNPAYSGYLPWGFTGPQGQSYTTGTPEQQAWYSQQMANSRATGNQWYYNPASRPADTAPAAPAPAAPAPAAPAPVAPTNTTITAPTPDLSADPSVTTGTGTPKVPNAIQAKSYDPNVDAKTGAGFANTSNAGGTNYSVGTDDTLKTNAAGDQISGFQRGGIPQRPTMKFADAGVVPFSAPGYQGTRTPGQQYYFSHDYVGPTMGGGWAGTPYAQLAPNQQQWADTMKPLVNMTGANWLTGAQQYTVMPNAVWPTTTPAATPVAQPAPTNTTITAATPAADPNNQPGAGAPGLANTLIPTSTSTTTPTTPAPIVDPTTSTVTNTPANPVPKQAKSYDPTMDTTGKNYKSSSTSNVGGADYSFDPTRDTNFGGRDYGQIQGFDDGGGVSPSALGMPPGLGGQQAPPPIYYNQATYSAAGAPVGKGVTQNSVPTYIAGAIPSLPMALGGMVKRYAEGGSVDDDTGVDEYSGRTNEDITEGGRSAGGLNEYSGEYGGAGAGAQPSPSDAGLPAWAPQINDGQGNPSKGLTGAIAGGLHYLASQLGLDGSGQQGAIAGDANIQANRRSFVHGDGVPGAPVPTHEEVSQLHSAIGADGLHDGLANLAGMEATRNFWLVHGDPQKADMMAASMLQYSVSLSRDYGGQAVERYYKNDLNGAVHALNNAKEAIADGTLMHATVNEDGQSVNVEGRDLSGKALWARTVGPEAILGAALHARDGSLAWHLYEGQAAKYDPQSQQLAMERRQARTWEHQQEVLNTRQDQREALINKREADKQAAADKAAQAETAVLSGMTQPRAPAITPVGTPPAIPGKPNESPAPTAPATPVTASATAPQATQPPPGSVADSTGTAATAAPPPTADARGLTGHGGAPPAIPGPPATAADLSSPQAQPVGADMGPPIPTRPDEIEGYASLPPAQQNEVWKTYQAQATERRNWENDQRREVGLNRREALTRESQENIAKRQQITIGAQEKAATARQEAQQTFETAKEQSARENAITRPRDQQDVARTFSTTPNETGAVTGKEPAAYIAEAMGYLKSDGTIDTDLLNKNFSRDELPTISNALVQGYHFSPNTDAPIIAKAITGTLTDPSYIMHKTEIPPDKTYGVPRYSITVEHRGTGTATSFVLPVEIYNNLKALYTNRQMAATTGAAREALAAPTLTAPNVEGFPGTRGAPPAPQTGFTAPPQPISPSQKWWLDQALGRGQPGVPAFPTPPPNEQGGRGYIQ